MVPINPKLPKNFSCTPNEQRPPSHRRWWHRPYIETFTWNDFALGLPEDVERERRQGWYDAWPSGTRYDVRCLDGGAWDRPTCWGMFATLEEAQACAEGA